MAAPQYADLADLLNLAVTSPVFSTFTDAEKNAELLAASRFADSYFRAKFTLPMTSWGDDVKQAVCDIAAYRMYRKRGYNPGAPGDAGIRQGYDDAVEWLKDVAGGDVSPDVIDSSSGAIEGTPTKEAQVLSSSSRGFTTRGVCNNAVSWPKGGSFTDD